MTAPKRRQSAGGNTNLQDPQDLITSAQGLERRTARIAGLGPEFLLDAQQLIVFCSAVGARQRTSLYLSAIGSDREVRDGGVFGLARPMRHHGRVAGLVRGLD